MVHTRETRASASEIKFLVPPELAPRIRHWARTHLGPDPHGSGPSADQYETSSLYFDSRDFDVFHRRGSFGRAKYRVRRYGQSPIVFLERKLRKPGLLIKRRTVAPLASLPFLHGSPSGWVGDWFHRRLEVRKLQPVCQINYHRMARVTDTSTGPARLTLDCDLSVAQVTEPRFVDEPTVTSFEPSLILELKYRVHLPAVFRRLVEEFALEPQSASKYRLGMTALGHRPARIDSPLPTGTDASYV